MYAICAALLGSLVKYSTEMGSDLIAALIATSAIAASLARSTVGCNILQDIMPPRNPKQDRRD